MKNHNSVLATVAGVAFHFKKVLQRNFEIFPTK